MLVRRLSTRAKALNLTPFVSPLLLRLHPDTVQRQDAVRAVANEQALKQLNVFLELAALGCNNDAFNARKQLLAMQDARSSEREAAVHFPLLFHVPGPSDELVEVKYTVEVPGRLVKRTLANPGRSPSSKTDPTAALKAPFARDWQRTTRRILQDLFQVAHVPLDTTALEQWVEQGDSEEDKADEHGLQAGEHNRAVQKQHEEFDKLFLSMLTREKNIVHDLTTGLEDGPTSQHAVLTSLLHSRLFLPKFSDPHMKKSAFHWVANLLLVNFMELRLHSLVWNKMTLLVTADEGVEGPQVAWDQDAPEKGMGILIPIGMDVDELIDFIYEHVEELEIALEEKAARDQAAAKKEVRRKHKKQPRRRRHFYEDEVDAMLGKR